MSDAMKVVREALESVFEGQTDYTKVAAAVRLLPSLESQVRAEAMEEAAKVIEEIDPEIFERHLTAHDAAEIIRARKENR